MTAVLEILGAVAGLSSLAARTCSKVWDLSNSWRDAPEDLHWLRDDLTRTQSFFSEVEAGASTLFLPPTKEGHASRDAIRQLVSQGSVILQRIETFVDKVLAVSKKPSDDATSMDVGKRARVYWISYVRRELVGLRKQLAEIRSHLCRLLILTNV